MDIIILFLAGALGALTKDIFKDNKLVMPKFEDGSLVLGFIGGIVIGGVVGYYVDGNPETAFLAGFAGYQILEALLPKNNKK